MAMHPGGGTVRVCREAFDKPLARLPLRVKKDMRTIMAL